ncbi:hypothetical protein C0584_03515 [Candidatus Parcubacteria bacterium]|nr:MAG: hypothetical protein C0584_03515 [Candidatus Parcubacteria bacterium]
MTKKKIGFIGVGIMGTGMINNLKKEFELFVYNRTRSKAEEISEINIVGSPKELGVKTDIVFVCVSNDEALRDVLYGDNGLFSGLEKGKTLVDSGTTSLELSEKIRDDAKKIGINFLDAPITGSKMGANNGTLMFMVGGQKEVFEKTIPVFQSMGKKFVYCGETPNGQKAKHSLNMTMSLILESYLEGMALGIKSGVPREAMQEILDNSGAKNGISDFKMKQILEKDFTPHFTLELMHKDLSLADDDRKNLNLHAPLADKIQEIFADSLSRKEEDICTIVKTLEEKNDIKFE